MRREEASGGGGEEVWFNLCLCFFVWFGLGLLHSLGSWLADRCSGHHPVDAYRVRPCVAGRCMGSWDRPRRSSLVVRRSSIVVRQTLCARHHERLARCASRLGHGDTCFSGACAWPAPRSTRAPHRLKLAITSSACHRCDDLGALANDCCCWRARSERIASASATAVVLATLARARPNDNSRRTPYHCDSHLPWRAMRDRNACARAEGARSISHGGRRWTRASLAAAGSEMDSRS